MIELLIEGKPNRTFQRPKVLLTRLKEFYDQDKRKFRKSTNRIIGIRNLNGHEKQCAVIARFLEKAAKQTVNSSTEADISKDL